MHLAARLSLLAGLLTTGVACGGDSTAAPPAGPDPHNPYGIQLIDVGATALPLPLRGGRPISDDAGYGTGVAIGDLDGDGRLDLLLARCDDPSSDRPGGPSLLLHNEGAAGGTLRFAVDERFTALAAHRCVHGVALGDVDGDGDLDVFLAAEGPDLLLENDGHGRFTDVTARAGVAGRPDDVSLGALFTDLDRDGQLDLYVANWNPTPLTPGDRARNRLHVNLGDGRFADVSAASGTDSPGDTWTAAALDLDGTGDLALYVANDRFTANGEPGPEEVPPDALYRLATVDADGTPRFVDTAAARGVATFRSSMGMSIADLDGDLLPDLYLSDQGRNAAYLHDPAAPAGRLVDGAVPLGVAVERVPPSFLLWSWGARFVDLDRDGALELLVANGFIDEAVSCWSAHQVPWYLRRPSPAAPFEVVTSLVGPALATPTPRCDEGSFGDPERTTTRAVVEGDLDGDGDDDFVLTSLVGPVRVLRNDTPARHHALRVALVGTVSSPDPVGAALVVTRTDGTRAAAFRAAGGDVHSQRDRVLTIGLGDAPAVARAEVRWPSGYVQRIDPLAVDALHTVTEPAWLTVAPRAASPEGPPPRLRYAPVDERGLPVGPAGASAHVTATRSDGVPVALVDHGDGTWDAPLPHPGVARRTVVTVIVDGAPLRVRPIVTYR